MFVGHFSVGKTTLVRQLQGLSAAGVESTDGIDVYRGKCYYNMESKEWITPGKIFCPLLVLQLYVLKSFQKLFKKVIIYLFDSIVL